MLRLLADDLTGALDSASPFAAAGGPIPVVWNDKDLPLGDGDLAVDTETRHAGAADAAARVGGLSAQLTGADPAFKKVDSCLRGQPSAEIAALTRAGRFRTTVVAPAFPAQGRITRAGRQHIREVDGGWRDAGVDLAAEFAALGLACRRGRPLAGPGLYFCDVETDDELAALAGLRRELVPPVLWCGSAGLSRALAGPFRSLDPATLVRPPVLVVTGSGNPVTVAQLDRLALHEARVRVMALRLPPGSEPAVAAAGLRQLVAEAAALPPPATLLVAGGETLMQLCLQTGAAQLSVEGEIAPGVPVSRMVGGRWAGVPVISKSGGFGRPGFFAELVAPLAGGSGDAR
ncbi:MAG: four-carbon acid sugar kinase family protein [Geminicoccaceae bacterium]